MAEKISRTGRRQHATIKEVAELAGVSQMTVSRVLNRRDVVREATRAKVEEAIRELKYRPNLLARSLAGGSSLFIGMIFNNPSNSYLSELLIGAMNRCREAGHHLVLEDFSSYQDPEDVDELVGRVSGAGLDGILVVPPLSEDDLLLSKLEEAGIPCVLIAPRVRPEEGTSLSIDDEAAAKRMTEYLIEHGHTRIGFVIGAEDQISSHRRYSGFQMAMQEHGLDIDPALVRRGRFTYRSGMEAADAMLELDDLPTAIFASNDDMAAGVIASAFRHGKRVPEDISVVGYDDTPIASAIWPQLTTVRQPIAEMGYQSVDLLASFISEDGADAHNLNPVLDVAIIERDTVSRLKR
jgi:LacI family transcriptional regulator